MSSNTPLISVIIPVYEAEEYLRQCFDSVLSQTYSNLEVILVDDGSPGIAPGICDEYAKKDNRVTVIHKQNGGHSDARNAGLDIASGEYITIVDCDDWIEPDMIEVLYENLVIHKVDISFCGTYRSYVNTEELSIAICPGNPLLLTNEEAVKKVLAAQISHGATAKLYKKEIFCTIRYPVGKTYDDLWIIVDVLMAANTILVDYTPKYHYRKRKSSIVNSTGTITRYKQKIEALNERHNKINSLCPGLVEISEAILYDEYKKIISSVLQNKNNEAASEDDEIVLLLINKIKEKVSCLLNNTHITLKEKVFLHFLNFNEKLYIRLQAFLFSQQRKKRGQLQHGESINDISEKILFR